MDALDIRIMREYLRGGHNVLFVDRRKSLRNIAVTLGVDKETVRSRIKRLQETGFLAGWIAVVNPNLLGVKQTALMFDVAPPASKEQMVAKVRRIPGLLFLADFVGTPMLLILYHETDDQVEAAAESLFGAEYASKVIRFENAFPTCTIPLTRTDWRLLRIMQKDPRRPVRLLAQDLGISTRTVKRRMERLVEGKALVVLPMLDIAAAEGEVANLVVNYADRMNRAEVDRAISAHLEESVFRLDLNQRTHGKFMLLLRNAAAAKAVATWIKSLDGVSKFRLDIFQERLEYWEAYHELAEKKIAAVLEVVPSQVPSLRGLRFPSARRAASAPRARSEE